MHKKYSPFIIVIFAILCLAVPRTIQATSFNDGTLIKGLSDKVYVIENGLKRWIKTADIFNGLGYSWANIKHVSEQMLSDTPPGKDLTGNYRYPDGALIRGIGPKIYLIEQGERRWIPSPEIFESGGFRWENVIQIADKIINRIKEGSNLSSIYNSSELRPQTVILDGPCKQHQASIPEINQNEIKFRYSGSIRNGSNDLRFETFLAGYDTSWKNSWSYERTIRLPNENKTYAFYVRAKTEDGYYDATPAFCKFETKLSSYNQQVEISSVQSWSADPDNEKITLKTKWSLSESINITGWTLKIEKRAPITIPQAVKSVYSDSIYNHKEDLILGSGEKVIIYGGASPIGINAYKVNKCMKYFDDKLEYDTCRYEHYQDPDFLEKEWRIYLNRTSEFLTEEDEEIILKDKNGMVVDIYSY